MKSNYTTEEVNDLLDEFNGCCSYKSIKQFKASKGLFIKPSIGWYTSDTYPLYLMYFGEDYIYGFDAGGAWRPKVQKDMLQFQGYDKATNIDVEQALTAEAQKRGFKEGVTFNCAVCDSRTSCEFNDFYDGTFGAWEFNEKRNSLSKKFNQYFFNNGKWAEIIEPKVKRVTMSDLADKYGCKVEIIKE